MTPDEAVAVARQALIEADEGPLPIAPWGYVLRDDAGYVVPIGDMLDDSRLVVHADGTYEWQDAFSDLERVDAMEAVDLQGNPVDLNNVGGQTVE